MHPSSSLGVTLNPGDVLAGKYRVERILGQGGMGIVVAATQLDLGRLVALKFLLDESAERIEVVARFLREARIVGGLRSEHVARVYELGQLENGAPYMAMEYLEGADLSRTLKELGRLHFTQAAAFIRQACEAIAEAHAAGVVHRDLKPANLFRTTRPNGGTLIKVLDFGISKTLTLDATEQGMTRTSTVMGSPYYMSPEQMARPKTVDLRTDIWSLGVILQELVTGKVPFQGETLAAIALSVHNEEAPPISSLNPEVPAAYQAIVSRCLQKQREHRFASAGELSRALEAIEGMPGSTGPMPLPADAPSTSSALLPTVALAASARDGEALNSGKTAGTWGGTIGNSRRAGLRLALAVSALGLLAVLGIVVAALWGRAQSPASAESAHSLASASGVVTPAIVPVGAAANAAGTTAASSTSVATVTAAPTPSRPPPTPVGAGAGHAALRTAAPRAPASSTGAAPKARSAPASGARPMGWDDELLKP